MTDIKEKIEELPMNVNLAIFITKYLQNKMYDVPLDIGLKLLEDFNNSEWAKIKDKTE